MIQLPKHIEDKINNREEYGNSVPRMAEIRKRWIEGAQMALEAMGALPDRAEPAHIEIHRIIAEVWEPVDGDTQLAITLNPDRANVIACMLKWGANRFRGGQEAERMNSQAKIKELEQDRQILREALAEYTAGRIIGADKRTKELEQALRLIQKHFPEDILLDQMGEDYHKYESLTAQSE